MNIILLGPPGCGKGSQANLMTSYYGLTHISTGQIFRDNIARETNLGKIAKKYIDDGMLVPDDITIDLVKDTLSNFKGEGYILDGFPRTVYQAEKLSEFAKIDRVLLLDVETEELKIRMLGRRNCSNCGEMYNVLKQDVKSCTKCGGELVKRSDDNEETVNNRIAVYEKSTQPLIDYYKEKKLLSEIESNGTIEQQFDNIKNELLNLGAKN